MDNVSACRGGFRSNTSKRRGLHSSGFYGEPRELAGPIGLTITKHVTLNISAIEAYTDSEHKRSLFLNCIKDKSSLTLKSKDQGVIDEWIEFKKTGGGPNPVLRCQRAKLSLRLRCPLVGGLPHNGVIILTFTYRDEDIGALGDYRCELDNESHYAGLKADRPTLLYSSQGISILGLIGKREFNPAAEVPPLLRHPGFNIPPSSSKVPVSPKVFSSRVRFAEVPPRGGGPCKADIRPCGDLLE